MVHKYYGVNIIAKSASHCNFFKSFFHEVNIWNSFPDPVVNADMFNSLNNRLDKHWLGQDVVSNFNS